MTRQEAMMWWNNLDVLSKEVLFTKYKSENWTPAGTWMQLTGREIQKIYEKTIIYNTKQP